MPHPSASLPAPSRLPGSAPAGDPPRRLTCGVCHRPDLPTRPVLISSGDLTVSIPLCENDAAGLMSSIDTWLAAAAASATAAAAKGRRLREGEAVTVIREWAAENGYPVAKAGSLSQPIIAAYRRAHAQAVPQHEPERSAPEGAAPRSGSATERDGPPG